MINRRKKFRLGFDISPRKSGPGRYLTAIVDALDPDEFDVMVFAKPLLTKSWPHVHYLDADQGADTNHSVSVAASSNGINTTPSIRGRLRLRTALPFAQTLPLWAGFHRDARRMSQRIRARDIDLFHAQNTGCEESPVAARRARGPCVLGTFHVDATYDLVPDHSRLRYRILESYSSRCLHQAIAVSESTRRFWIKRTGIAADRVITIHNGVNPDRIRRESGRRDARRRLGIPDDGRVILGGVGRLDVAKGFTHLIDAMALLHQECPNTLLVIAGSGPLEDKLVAQAASAGLQDSVRFLGYCQDVALVYDALDVFVLSSICDAMPFALLEAMSHELPAVGTTVGGVPEVIVSGQTGFLAAARDSDALARAILPLLQSEDLRQRLGAAGRQRVISHFHEADMVRKTVQVYRRLLNSESL